MCVFVNVKRVLRAFRKRRNWTPCSADRYRSIAKRVAASRREDCPSRDKISYVIHFAYKKCASYEGGASEAKAHRRYLKSVLLTLYLIKKDSAKKHFPFDTCQLYFYFLVALDRVQRSLSLVCPSTRYDYSLDEKDDEDEKGERRGGIDPESQRYDSGLTKLIGSFLRDPIIDEVSANLSPDSRETNPIFILAR